MPRLNQPGKVLPITMLAMMCMFCVAHSARSADAPAVPPTSQPVDLALNKPATASATENDDNASAKANDGDDDTRWCADGDSVPQWWQVDLGAPNTVTGCKIKFEFDQKKYQYVIEGSADASAWKTLSDQSATTKTDQVQSLTFDKPADGIRYVRIRFTALDDGCWASMFDFKVFGK
jgi:hypothetical protein